MHKQLPLALCETCKFVHSFRLFAVVDSAQTPFSLSSGRARQVDESKVSNHIFWWDYGGDDEFLGTLLPEWDSTSPSPSQSCSSIQVVNAFEVHGQYGTAWFCWGIMKWLSWAWTCKRAKSLALKTGHKPWPCKRATKPCQRAGKHRRKDETFAACWDETFFNWPNFSTNKSPYWFIF